MSKLLDRLTLVALCVLGAVLASLLIVEGWHRVRVVPIVRAQGDPTGGNKTVLVNKTRRLDPIEVVKVLEGGKEVAPGDPSQDDLNWLMPKDLPLRPARQFRTAYKFPAGESWLRDLSLVLLNRTSKNIVHVSMHVTFPETTATGPMLWPTVRFGQLPDNVAFFVSGEAMPPRPEEPIFLEPGEERTFPLVEQGPHLRKAIEGRQPFSTVSMCYIHFEATFDDGMHWGEVGGYSDPDPDHPGRFTPTDMTYFPGPLVGPPAE